MQSLCTPSSNVAKTFLSHWFKGTKLGLWLIFFFPSSLPNDPISAAQAATCCLTAFAGCPAGWQEQTNKCCATLLIHDAGLVTDRHPSPGPPSGTCPAR